MRTYKKDTDFSYTIGAFPTLELLTHRPGQIELIYLSPKAEQSSAAVKIKGLATKNGIRIEVNERALLKLVKSENHLAAAVFNKYATGLEKKNDHLLLVNPDDMGNLGTIIRTMLGFGIKDLALIRPAADIFDPKVIRASMGAVFQLNFSYFESFEGYQRAFPRQYYPFMTTSALELELIKFGQPATLIFGNEGAGLPMNFAKIGQPVRIEQTRNIDSLNLAIAAGIGLRELFRQRNS